MSTQLNRIAEPGELPDGWETQPLSEIGAWSGGMTPSKANHSFWDHRGVWWITPKDFRSRIITDSVDKVSDFGVAATSLRLYPRRRSVCIVFRSGILRRHLPVAVVSDNFTVNQDVKCCVVEDEAQAEYLLNWLSLHERKVLSQHVKAGTTVESIDGRSFFKMDVPLPPIPEQHGIVKRIREIDEAIGQTRALLAKRRRLHEGLADALLTRGIGTDGRLRQEDTSLFKSTDLGNLPEEWDAVPLGEVLLDVEYGLSVAMDEQGAVPILRMNNQKNGETDVSDLKYVSASTAASRLLRDKDVLFNRTNSIEHVGRTSIWRGQLSACTFASYLLRLVPHPEKVDSEFLNAALNRPHVQARIKQIATRAVQQANINPTNLRAFQLPIPRSLDEQRHIMSVLSNSRSSLETLRREINKLTRLKSGLMQVLLTGRVRVASSPTAS